MKKLFVFLLALLMIFLSFPVFADENEDNNTESAVLHGFKEQFVRSRATALDTINSESLWEVQKPTVTSLTFHTEMQCYPYTAIDNDGFYQVFATNSPSDFNYIIRDYGEETVDISAYSSIIIPLNCDYSGIGTYEAIIIIKGIASSVTYKTTDITPREWNGVICDISSFEEAGTVQKIYVGMRFTSAQGVQSSFNYYLDSIYLSSKASAEGIIQSAYFLTDTYSLSGSNNFVSYDSVNHIMKAEITYTQAEHCSLYSGSLPKGIFTSAQAIKIKLKNLSGTSKLTLEYATENQGSFKQNPQITVNLEKTEDIQTVYFPLTDINLTEFKISFDDDAAGEIYFYSVSPASYYSPVSESYSTNVTTEGYITSCKLSGEENIIVKGSISDTGLSAYKGTLLQIYEIPGYETADSIFSESSRPLKSINISSSFSFEIPLYDDDGRSRLTSSFAVVIYNSSKNTTILLTSPCYITNAGSLSEYTVEFNDTDSKKGYVGELDDIIATNSKYTVLDVDYSTAFYSSGDSIYEYNGRSYRYNEEYFSELDKKIADLNVFDCNVYLRISDMSNQGIYNALSARGQSNYERMSAFASLISERYFSGKYGHNCVGIILGKRLDFAYRYNNTAICNLRIYVNNYCSALRLFSTTIRSYSANAEIYIPLGNIWEGYYSDTSGYDFYGRDIADLLAETIKKEGNISYGFVLDPYKYDAVPVTDITDSSLTYISYSNLADVCGYLGQSKFSYNENKRSILVMKSGDSLYSLLYTTDSDAFINEAVLGYAAVNSESCNTVKAIIFTSDSVLGDKSEISDAIRYIDTEYDEDYIQSALYYLSVESLEEITGKKSSSGYITLRELNCETDISEYNITGEADLFAISEDKYDLFSYSSSIVSYNEHIGYMGEDNVLYLRGDKTSAYNLISIEFPYERDFSYSPIISFTVYSSTDCKGKILMYSSAGCCVFSFGLEIGKNTVICDLTGFEELCRLEEITIYLAEFENIYISSINASSEELDSDGIIKKFRSEYNSFISTSETTKKFDYKPYIIVVLAVIVIFEIVYILIRRQKISKANEKIAEERRKKLGF